MFDDKKRGLEIRIDLPLDDDGYFDRQCPNSECQAVFKVVFEDWKEKVSEVVFCPFCRSENVSTKWNTTEQQEYIKRTAYRYINEHLSKTINQSIRRFNRSQRSGGLIQMSMTYRPGPKPILIPFEALEIMRQRMTCEKCSCRYASIGAAFFCPACGYNSASSTFDATVETVRKIMCAVPTIQQALIEDVDEDVAADSTRQILENSLVKLVSSFQRFAEAYFDSLPNRPQFNPRRNVFQTLSEASNLWRPAIGVGYEDMLTSSEFLDLERYFQQRHLLAHKDGIVDQQYLDRTSDSRYIVGQRLVVRKEDVLNLGDLVSKLAQEIRKRSCY